VTVVLSLFLVAVRAAQPRRTFLVRVPGTDSFRGIDSVADGAGVPGLVIYRFDGPLFFANAQVLGDDIHAAVEGMASPVPARWVVLDAESIDEVDSTAATALADLADDLAGRGIELVVARLKSAVSTYLGRAGVIEKIGADRIYLEVDDAVDAFLAEPVTGEQREAKR
jgi:SulP family sulfate permease